MPVIVKADDTAIRGVISAVDPRIENGVARFYADLSVRNHPKLRNNLRVDVFAVTGGKDGVLQLRRGLIAQAPQEDVFVVRGETLVRTSARFGLSGEENVEVTDGLEDGDEVVISNMTDSKTLKQLRIK
jgi:HlyD family secretion protein